MADVEHIEHPYALYNKPTPMPRGSPATFQAPTLVGNWAEERAQAETTGIARYEVVTLFLSKGYGL